MSNARGQLLHGSVQRVVATRVFEECGQRLTLHDCGTHHELLIGKVPLLTSARLQTERDFGNLARVGRGARAGGRRGEAAPARVLVGGLGFGATLARVLAVCGARDEVIVVEKLRTVVALVRGEMSHVAPRVLDDPRVTLLQRDVADVIQEQEGLDAILLDVDNGPDWASFRSNSRLYSRQGVARAARALKKGGRYAVWSGYGADGFLKTLVRAGLEPSVVPLYERGKLQARAYVGFKR